MSDPEWCFWCPFKGCQSCAHKGSDDHARQGDSGAWGRLVKRDIRTDVRDNGSEHGAAPERCVNTAEGLTLTRLPTRPGGFSG